MDDNKLAQDRSNERTGRDRRFYGKYRGKVVNNIDPQFMARIMVSVPTFPADITNYAMPCTPYAGLGVGFYAVPDIGADVWVEFERGDPDYPIWSGCFWSEGKMPPIAPTPATKFFKTDFITMILNDTPGVGGFTLSCINPAVEVPLTMTFNSTGITISCPEATIKMTPGSITLSVPEALYNMSPEGIEIALPPTSVNLTAAAVNVLSPEISATADAALSMKAGADLSLNAGAVASLSGGAATSVRAGADLTLNAGGATQLDAVGNVSISAATAEIDAGELNILAETNVEPVITEDGDPVMVVPV